MRLLMVAIPVTIVGLAVYLVKADSVPSLEPTFLADRQQVEEVSEKGELKEVLASALSVQGVEVPSTSSVALSKPEDKETVIQNSALTELETTLLKEFNLSRPSFLKDIQSERDQVEFLAYLKNPKTKVVEGNFTELGARGAIYGEFEPLYSLKPGMDVSKDLRLSAKVVRQIPSSGVYLYQNNQMKYFFDTKEDATLIRALEEYLKLPKQ